MQVDRDLVLKLEDLAQLDLSESARTAVLTDLNNILRMIDQLSSLDTEGVPPLTHLSEEPMEWRPDEVGGQLDREATFLNAPDTDGTYFRVPKLF
ncbi:MAG: hypothetical protein RLY31_2726 [Bacteroidota bacterium]|jgi:aspartyl-tRNA(Asn)/glutamyl-tRNA(Gln) amidotransferase subunit C